MDFWVQFAALVSPPKQNNPRLLYELSAYSFEPSGHNR